MTPVEKIQAAIEKLERLRAGSTGSKEGRWRTGSLLGDDWVANDGLWVVARATPGDCDLIVTLHRTIDAQLELLRSALKFIGETRGASSHSGSAFTLADAILGDPS